MSSTYGIPIRFQLLPVLPSTVVQLPLGFEMLQFDPTIFVWGEAGTREAVAQRVWDGSSWFPSDTG